MRKIVLSVIGGGSTYTPELIDGIGRRKEALPVSEVRLCDPNEERTRIVAEFARRQLKFLGSPATVRSTTSLPEALDGASFVVSQIRVGGQAARQKDTELGLRNDLIGQETTGCGGFACALRHIPASIEIAKEMEKRCPDAVLMNFTNPAGLVTQALINSSKIRTVGICNVPWVMRKDIAGLLGVPFESVELDYFGLNHLSWVTRVRIGEKDRTGEVLQNYRRLHESRYNFPPELIESIQALPSPYLQYYYLLPEIVDDLKKAPKTRAQEVMEIESSLLKLYSDPGLREKPEELMKRGGIYYGEVASAAMAALAGEKPERHIVNLPNGGVFPWLSKEAVIEYGWKINKNGYRPDRKIEAPAPMKALMTQMAAYQELTIRAALARDSKAAYQALLVNPLVASASKAKTILEELEFNLFSAVS